MKAAIVYDTNDLDVVKELDRFKSQLLLRGLKVNTLGFINKKQFPENLNISSGNDYFNRKNLNWLGLPTHSTIQSIFQERIDYLILASLQWNPILFSFATAQTPSFRIGPYLEDKTPFLDLMIELKTNDEVSDYFNSIIHYITLIKQHEH